jgi:hypothetical protein
MCVFNPIELIWSQFKRRIREKATSKSKINDVIEIGLEVLAGMPTEIVKNCADHVASIEQEFRGKEGTCDFQIDPIIIPLEEEDEDDRIEWLDSEEEDVDDEDMDDEDMDDEEVDENADINVWDCD